ncbi:glycosyltransferase family 2 protein [Saccharospirillum mangrovi]|uniref:glycosyltransferase family 2 protein n=1 Tax=Saccharospirillum mangrovi TaxID=2161747 RepID=UPI000D38FBB1|nr:glycosyltransferase family 2 protein [Saccharospirillum mangrovi]
MKVGVVVTTYNSPRWLEKVLWGYENQDDTDFTLIIADDGSGDETRQLVNRFVSRGKLNIVHEWQPDDGFQKTKILNQCVRNTDCDYLIFTDGDCIPRSDYISAHKAFARPGRFVSGGLYRLSMAVSESVEEMDVVSQQVFDFAFLQQRGQQRDFKKNKLTRNRFLATCLNRLTPTKATWNGGNTGCWRRDILAVNGFDERMQYGGLDREIGERMSNNGIRGVQARYSVITLHLDHSRGYENEASWKRNRAIRNLVKSERRNWTDYGLERTSRFQN